MHNQVLRLYGSFGYYKPMNLKDSYIEEKAWGIAVAIDLHSCNPDTIRSMENIKQYVYELCDLIKVKRFGECTIVHFGERDDISGFSMTQLIETSLVSGHFANKTNNVYLDVFSCNYFDPDIVVKKSREFFEAESLTFNILLRK